MILDPDTTLYISRTMIFIGAIAMTVGAWQHREIPGLKIWVMGYAAMVIANYSWLEAKSTDTILLGFGNFITICGFILFWQGSRAFQRQGEKYFGLSVLIALIALFGNFYYAVIEPAAHIRYLLSATLALLLTGATCYSHIAAGVRNKLANLYLATFFGFWTLYTAYRVGLLLLALNGSVSVDATQNFVSTILVYSYLLVAFVPGAIMAAGQRISGQLREQADTDSVTGVFNRRAFDMAAGQALDQCARRGSNVSLIMLSTDQMGVINRRFGQSEAERLMKRLATILQSIFRAQDVIARMAGKEFCIFLPNTEMTVARRMAERLRERVNTGELRALDGSNITLSIGITSTNAATTSKAGLQTLVEEADLAHHRAKQEGRDRVEVYEPASN